MSSADIGVIGLGTMGKNIALNFASRGYKVLVYNRTSSVTEDFMEGVGRQKGIAAAYSLSEFTNELSKPRKILLMVTAGSAVDSLLYSLKEYLQDGDVVMDGGNSFYKDTQRRASELLSQGIEFCGIGISGGEEGALKGPSIMAGCSEEAWEVVRAMLESISAKDFEGGACCARFGEDGAGHFVKMVHNGIEYVILELIAESYDIMRIAGYSNDQIADLFDSWESGKLKSYLVEIASKVLRFRDKETGRHLVDLILDAAEQKGTGIWSAQTALELGVPAFSIVIAPQQRSMSSMKDSRVEASKKRKRGKEIKGDWFKVEKLEKALISSQLIAYAQGFEVIRGGSKEYSWKTDLSEAARVWQGGCIIRSELLRPIRNALTRNADRNLLLDDEIYELVRQGEEELRSVVAGSSSSSIPVPAFSSTLAYFDSYFSEKLPANLIQAMRDYFGAHGYRRVDREGRFHTEWEVD